MRTTLLSILVIGTWASVAMAEPLPATGGAQDDPTAEAHAAGPITLTEAEMDQVAAGAVVNWSASLAAENEVPPVSMSKTSHRLLKWERKNGT